MRQLIFAGISGLFFVSPSTAQDAGLQTPQWRRGLERTYFNERLEGSDAEVGAGIAALLYRKVVRLSPDGVPAWSVDACAACAPNDPDARAWAVDLLPDGSAWVLVTRPPDPPATVPPQFVVRVGADGAVLGETAIPSFDRLRYVEHVALTGNANQVVVFAPAGHAAGIRRTRVNAGSVLESRTIAFGGQHADAVVTALRRWSDGSLSVAVVEQNTAGCMVDPPVCPTPRATLLRLEVNGTERWRTDLGTSRPAPFMAFEDDDTSVAITAERDAALSVRTVAPNGTASAPVVIPGIVGALVTKGAGPVDGRYLIAGSDHLWLIDRTGATLASRPTISPWQGVPLASGAHGFIVTHPSTDAVLLSATDLGDIANIAVGNDGIVTGAPQVSFWRVLADGSIYTSIGRTGDDEARVYASRFAAPGSPAFDRVFVDGFD